MSKTKKTTKKDEGPAVIILRLYDISLKTLDAAIKREGYANRNEWFQLQAAKVTGTKTEAEKTGEKPAKAKKPRTSKPKKTETKAAEAAPAS